MPRLAANCLLRYVFPPFKRHKNFRVDSEIDVDPAGETFFRHAPRGRVVRLFPGGMESPDVRKLTERDPSGFRRALFRGLHRFSFTGYLLNFFL
jgi:hypothetical protein